MQNIHFFYQQENRFLAKTSYFYIRYISTMVSFSNHVTQPTNSVNGHPAAETASNDLVTSIYTISCQCKWGIITMILLQLRELHFGLKGLLHFARTTSIHGKITVTHILMWLIANYLIFQEQQS